MADNRGISVGWKVAVTAVFGAFTYLVTNITDQSQVWQISITVFISGAALIVQYLMDFERRLGTMETALERHAETMVTAMRTGLAQVNEATRLFTLVERSPVPTVTVNELVQNVTELNSTSPSLVHDFAKVEMEELTNLLKGLRDNQFEYEGEDHDWILALTDCCTGTMNATSSAIDTGLWSSRLGRRYLQAQVTAIGRGVIIRRVFIVRHAAGSDEDVQQLRRTHELLGIQAKVVTLESLSPSAQLETTSDFIVFDGAISYETLPDPYSQATEVGTTRLILNADRVAKRTRHFEELWEAGS